MKKVGKHFVLKNTVLTASPAKVLVVLQVLRKQLL